jgi:hypothetical protein
MSRLWSITLIVLALGLGFIGGILLTMFVFVMPRDRVDESRWVRSIDFQGLLKASSPEGTEWNIRMDASPVHGYGRRSLRGRTYLADCKMGDANAQTTLSTSLDAELIKLAQKQKGWCYSMGGSAGSGTEESPGGSRSWSYKVSTLPFTVGDTTGFVHITQLVEGDRVTISMVIVED